MLYSERMNRPVMVIIAVNVLVYLVTLIPPVGRFFFAWGALIPVKTFAGFQLWRLVTYMFLHDVNSMLHLAFNMICLYFLGRQLASVWSSTKFVVFYFVSGILAGCFSLLYLLFPSLTGIGVIGASGAVMALLTVVAFYFPQLEVLLFFILPVNIRIVVALFAVVSVIGTVAPRDTVSHLTHLGGILVALMWVKWYPLIHEWYAHQTACRGERRMRERVETAAQKRRFFGEQIDPILEKISREGRASLTPQEEKLLAKVAASKDRNELKKRKIIPFDLFR